MNGKTSQPNWAARCAARWAVAAICAMALPPAIAAGETRLAVTDKVVGGGLRYIGGYGLPEALANPEARKLLAETAINCTKVWLLEPKHWRRNGEFLGPDYKELAVRQATRFPETINWPEELSTSTTAGDLASFESGLKLLKDFGAQVVLNFKTKLYKDELKRRMYWRHVFLMNYYLNKVKDYKFVLWEFGCEDAREGPEQLEVGSDAVRASAKLTGLPVLVAGPGEDGDVDKDHRVILANEWAGRIDALSFHTFQWPENFPARGVPTRGDVGSWRNKPMADALAYLDNIQRQLRPNSPVLPYWDTGWSWRTAASHEGEDVWPAARFTSLAYIGRIIQQCQSHVQVNLYCRLYGPRERQDALRDDHGKLVATPLFYAIRMMARACAGQKERLDVQGQPDDSVMQTLVTRSPTQLFITCLSRTSDRTIKAAVNGLDKYKGRDYVVYRHDEKRHDEIVERGKLAGELAVELPPLTALQVVLERE